MSEVVELYTKGIKRKLENYWAAWLPGTHYAIGDVGTLNGYVFEKVCTLGELNLKYYADTDEDPSPLAITSEFGVAVSFKAAGESNPSFSHIGSAEAGLKVAFGAIGAFILQAPETFASEMGDRLNVRRQIIATFNNGSWEKDWLVITRLLTATSATVLISKLRNASLELTAKANLSAAMTTLGAADAGITIKHQQGDSITMIGGKNVTPLFQLGRLKTSFFSAPKLVTKSFRASDPSLAELTPSRVRDDHAVEESLVFETLTDDELA